MDIITLFIGLVIGYILGLNHDLVILTIERLQGKSNGKNKKEINMGLGVILYIVIDDGIAVITSNKPELLKKMALQGKQEGKDLGWSDRTQSWSEKAPGKSAEEIWEILEGYFNIGLIRQKEKVKELKDKEKNKK